MRLLSILLLGLLTCLLADANGHNERAVIPPLPDLSGKKPSIDAPRQPVPNPPKLSGSPDQAEKPSISKPAAEVQLPDLSGSDEKRIDATRPSAPKQPDLSGKKPKGPRPEADIQDDGYDINAHVKSYSRNQRTTGQA